MNRKLVTTGLLLSALMPVTAPAVDNLFRTLEGRWASEGKSCDNDAQTIDFTATDRIALFTRPVSADQGGGIKAYTYTVLASDDNSVHLFLDEEARRTANGSLVLWVVEMDGPDGFHWKRSDWEPGKLTKAIRRCE